MSLYTKMLLNGANFNLICEGAFSDLIIELTERIESLIDAISRVGDFEFGNSLNPKYVQFKNEFDSIVAELDKYDLNCSDFVKQTTQQKPNITFIEILTEILKKFL